MRHKTRICSALLALVMLVTFLPVPQAGAAGTAVYNGVNYSTDYTNWRQADPAWGPTALGDVHTFGGSGCLISAIAMLMCHSGAYDPANLNPGVFRDWLDAKGCISHSADRSKDALLSFGMITANLSPRFYFVNQEFFTTTTPLADVVSRASALISSGYYVVARVKYSGHFVAIGNTIDGDARIFDSGYNSKKLLSEYDGTIGGLIYFKANPSGKDTILPSFAAPSAPSITNFNSTYGTLDNITVSWTPTALATHYNLYVDQKLPDGSWKENVQYHFYATSPFHLNPLPAGTYRIKAQATNANTAEWTYANSPYKEFTVKAGLMTISYNANGGSCNPGSDLVQPWTYYKLPVPTRNNAAFLGWFTSDGKFVNNSTLISTNKGHTLTAKWDTSGVGFQQNAAYNGQFWDVPRGSWYYNNIATCYAYGLMNGVDPNHFDPNAQITATQAIVLASRMHKLYTTGGSSFPATDPWYKAYSTYAIQKRIISSEPKDMTCALTRQEFAAILANALPDTALPAINEVKAGSLPDVYRSDTAIYKLYRAGIFAGSDAAGTFRPNAPITRAEVATVLVRMADPNYRVLFTIR